MPDVSFTTIAPASSRRSFLLLPLCVAFYTPTRLAAANTSRFWNQKDPAQWTSDEILRLTTNSPWAKQVAAELNNDNSSLGGGAPRSGGRGGRRGGGGGGGSMSSNLPKFQAVVRWASAAPIREALKLKLPSSLDGHYVISVSGLPLMSAGENDSQHDPFEMMKEQTKLQVKRGDPVEPGVAYEEPNSRSTVYFGFLPQLVSASEGKSATFSMSTGPLSVKVKFDFNQMKYRGELAV
jgi:hypothetical protein